MILLDTHALVWLDRGAPELGPEARKHADAALCDEALAVSAVSFWEIATLCRRGRLQIEQPLGAWRRGLFDMGALNAISEKMYRALAHVGGRIDALFFCPHAADSNCDCRKPKPGMLVDIAQRFNVDLTGVPSVGDSLRDLQAASIVGAQPMLVQTGKGKKTQAAGELPENTLVFPDLAHAVRHIIAES